MMNELTMLVIGIAIVLVVISLIKKVFKLGIIAACVAAAMTIANFVLQWFPY